VPQGRSGRAENLVPTGIRSRTVQPVAQSLYRLSYPLKRVPKEYEAVSATSMTRTVADYDDLSIQLNVMEPSEGQRGSVDCITIT